MKEVLHKISFQALGTVWWVEYDLDKNKNVSQQIQNKIHDFETQYSRFKPDSLLSRLNATKILEKPPQEFYEMLFFSQDIKNISEGYFNISIGGYLEKEGYNKDFQVQNNTNADTVNIKQNIFRSLEPNKIQLEDEVRIDLGGFGKGWLVDNIGSFFKSIGSKNFRINAGGDLLDYSQVEIEDSENWLYLQHPLEKNKAIGKIKLQNQALASSSNLYRTWQNISGQAVSHLVNPYQTNPKNELDKSTNSKFKVGTFVLSSELRIADALATALFVSPNSLNQKIGSYKNSEYLVIYNDLTYTKSDGFEFML